MPSDGERRGDEALRIAEQVRARRRREGHTMAGQGPQEASPNVQSEGPNRVISPPDWYGPDD